MDPASELLLVQILSQLGKKESARTSVLSKIWRNQWTGVDSIVDRTLERCNCLKIKEFSVTGFVVGPELLQAVSATQLRNEYDLPFKLRHLSINSRELPGIPCLLGSSPNLELLVMRAMSSKVELNETWKAKEVRQKQDSSIDVYRLLVELDEAWKCLARKAVRQNAGSDYESSSSERGDEDEAEAADEDDNEDGAGDGVDDNEGGEDDEEDGVGDGRDDDEDVENANEDGGDVEDEDGIRVYDENQPGQRIFRGCINVSLKQGYCNFASQFRDIYFGDAERRSPSPSVIVPWRGWEVSYMGVGEKELNPIKMGWEQFKAELRLMVCRPLQANTPLIHVHLTPWVQRAFESHREVVEIDLPRSLMRNLRQFKLIIYITYRSWKYQFEFDKYEVVGFPVGWTEVQMTNLYDDIRFLDDNSAEIALPVVGYEEPDLDDEGGVEDDTDESDGDERVTEFLQAVSSVRIVETLGR